MTASAIAFVISSTDRIASSLPAIGTVMRSGSAFVSQMAIIGMPSLFASATAMFSFFDRPRTGCPAARHAADAERFFDSFSRSRRSMSCSFLV